MLLRYDVLTLYSVHGTYYVLQFLKISYT